MPLGGACCLQRPQWLRHLPALPLPLKVSPPIGMLAQMVAAAVFYDEAGGKIA